MSGSVNKVILVGNLGKDPEVRHLENGAAVANFSIATSETYKDRKTGEKVSQTEWHNIVAWRGLAEIAERYLKKGHKVYIEGKLKTRSWQDQDGNNRYSTEVITDNLTMLGSNSSNDSKSDFEEPQTIKTEPKKSPNKEFSEPGDDDDLPF
jgi:single-strand DNA-binding protein